ncbi:MAG: tRNA (cytidine(56)-2'-O)-methyltransferase, partial [Candidatus Aenigmatarchaeota archaeon]
MSEIVVLRIGHRPGRDRRISTHAALVARAFGADGIFFSDYKVREVKESLNRVNEDFGGEFY